MTDLGRFTFALVLLGLAPARADIPPPDGCQDQCGTGIGVAGTVCIYCADSLPLGDGGLTSYGEDGGITYYLDGGSPRCMYYPAPPFRPVCEHWMGYPYGWKDVWCNGPVRGANDAGAVPLLCPPDAGTDAPHDGGGGTGDGGTEPDHGRAGCLVGGSAARTVGPWAFATSVALLLVLLGRRRRR